LVLVYENIGRKEKREITKTSSYKRVGRTFEFQRNARLVKRIGENGKICEKDTKGVGIKWCYEKRFD